MPRARTHPSSATRRRRPETLTRGDYRIALKAVKPAFKDIDLVAFKLLVGQAERGLSPRELAKVSGRNRPNLDFGGMARLFAEAIPDLELWRDDYGEPLKFSAICDFCEVDGRKAWVIRPPLLEAASDLGLKGESLEEDDPFDESPQASAREGAIRFRFHRHRERAPGLRQSKFKNVLAATGRLACEICDSDYRDQYGPGPRFCFEVHHRRPLSEVYGEQETCLEDLAVLCVLCHRFIHSLPELPTVEEAREQYLAHAICA